MLVVESSMAGGRKEVALAAIAVITTVMQAHGTTKAVSRRYLHTSHSLSLLLLSSPLTCRHMAPPRLSPAGTCTLYTHCSLAITLAVICAVMQANGTIKAVSLRYLHPQH